MSYYHSTSRDPLIALIIDEELHSRQRLSRLLREIAPEFTGIAEASTEPEALTKIERFAPNLIFATCHFGARLHNSLLAGCVRRIPKVILCKDPTEVHNGLREFGGFFLVKPVDAQHLRDLLDALGDLAPASVQKSYPGPNGGAHPAHMNNGNGSQRRHRSASGSNGQTYLNRLVVRRQGRFRLLPAERVIWFGTEFRLVYAHTEIRRYPIDMGLDQLEHRLDPMHFVRVHRSAIVNVNRIKEIIPLNGGRSKILLGEPEQRTLPLSASRAKAIKAILEDHHLKS